MTGPDRSLAVLRDRPQPLLHGRAVPLMVAPDGRSGSALDRWNDAEERYPGSIMPGAFDVVLTERDAGDS